MNETINKATGETIKYNRIGGTQDNPIYFNDPLPAPTNQPANITGDSLAPAQRINVPTPNTNTNAGAIIASTTQGALSDIEKARLDAEAIIKASGNQGNQAQQLLSQRAKELSTSRGDIVTNQTQIEEQAGLGEEQKILGDLNRQIADQQVQFRAEQDRIRSTPMSKGQAQQEINSIEDTYGRRLADLAIRKSASLGNIEAIKSDAERKTKLLLAPIDNEIEYLKTFGQQNVDNLTKQEEKTLNLMIKSREEQKANVKELEKAKADMITELAQNGGGKSDFIRQINEATTISDVYNLGAKSGFVGSLDRTLKLAQISKAQADAQKARAEALDKDSITLSEVQLKNVDNSPQGKALKALADMKIKQDRYKSLVEVFGFEAVGENKSAIDRAYADFKIAYKEAANLGALTGPDVGLIEEAVKPASGIENYFTYVTSGGQRGIVDTLQKATTNAKKEALTNYKNLTARNPIYSQSEYVKTFIDPFSTPLESLSKDGLTKLQKGEIIKTPEGVYLESLGNGNFSQI